MFLPRFFFSLQPQPRRSYMTTTTMYLLVHIQVNTALIRPGHDIILLLLIQVIYYDPIDLRRGEALRYDRIVFYILQRTRCVQNCLVASDGRTRNYSYRPAIARVRRRVLASRRTVFACARFGFYVLPSPANRACQDYTIIL